MLGKVWSNLRDELAENFPGVVCFFIFSIVLFTFCRSVTAFFIENLLYLSEFLTHAPKSIVVQRSPDEANDVLEGKSKFDYGKLKDEKKTVFYWDPSTLDYLGETKAMTTEEVNATVDRARKAQKKWRESKELFSFKTRRQLMRTMLKYFTENQEAVARVACRDSGKTLLDAIIGEVLVTCEKLTWLCSHGERYLSREHRETGRMMMMKNAYVDYTPLGVIGAIVPWNYPFHNVFNPVSAALFAGNAIVLKVSEYASWSMNYYKRIIDACLESLGLPKDLVQFVVGYGETGAALVKSRVDKLIFVGSPGVGAFVARDAAANWTPVVLELGGKDPFVVCDDVDVSSIVQTAVRGVWQNMGQNCAGPERFYVYEKVYDEFVDECTKIVKKLKTGPTLGDPTVDCGAICMGPNEMARYQKLVDDAVRNGARIMTGGYIPDKSKNDPLANGSFYPPTILADVPEDALIANEEIFGPIMCIFKVKGSGDAGDEEAIRMANKCDFALSSCAFSGSKPRAVKVGSQLNAGMSSINDLEGTTYMNQSLPFGGLKKSGYDRFAGPEGLRGLCSIRSVCEDKISFIRNSIPPPMQYPATGFGHKFAQGLIKMFYSTSWTGPLQGIAMLIAPQAFVEKSNPKK